MKTPAPHLLAVGIADVLATYAYVFAVQALTPPSGPHAPVTYWMTQPWIYLLIAPVAAVATWQGLRQAAALQAGDRRWWRLSLVAAAIGAVAMLAVSFPAWFSYGEVIGATTEVAAISAGLGLLLTGINYAIVRPARLAPTSA